MESKTIYEYLTVKEWFGNLDKGTRFYFDYDRQGYVYHYESDSTSNDERYLNTTSRVEDYFINVTLAEDSIRKELLVAGPKLGELEFNNNKKLEK